MKETFSLVARIVASHGRIFFVSDDKGTIYEASRSGKKNDAVVGDIVECSAPVSGKVSILAVRERKNRLFRSDKWRTKTVAANLDAVAIVFASRPTYNPWFIWKAVVAARAEGIQTIIVKTKTELAENGDQTRRFVQELEHIGETVLQVSALSEPELTREILAKNFSQKTILLVGQSGMGKSTLLNTLCPDANARTREFSVALDNGKQTTTETRLFPVAIGQERFELIDSPGFQEFGVSHLTRNDILRAMPDIAECVCGCRYYNCTHTHEPGCSVLKALEENRISQARHDFYTWMIEHAVES